MTPPGRSAHRFEYDGRNRLSTYKPPKVDGESMPVTYEYDPDGRLTKTDYPDGATLTRTFDDAGKLTEASTPSATRSHSYSSQTGQLTGISSSSGQSVEFDYDGSLRTETSWSGPVSGTVSRSYDDSFRVQARSVNQSHRASFSYDDDSRVTEAGGMTVTRDPDTGFVTSTAIGAVTTEKTYNDHGELKEHVAKANGSTVYEAEYVRDDLGRIRKVTETIEGTTTTIEYSYDQAGRLISAAEDGTVRWEYEYDQNGNRLRFRDHDQNIDQSGTYDAQDRTKTYAGTDYDWTDRGDLRQKTTSSGETTTFDYDVWGNLREMTMPSGATIDYVVDPKNRRIGKKVDGTFERGWLYDDQLTVVAELGPNQNVHSRFIYATNSHSPDLMEQGGTTYRYITDSRGSVRLIINTSSGNIVQRLDYSPYGRVLDGQSARMQPFGFAGGLWDRDSGLVRFGARDYEARSGRWIQSEQPLPENGTTNGYRYVHTDPTNWVDPQGKAPVKPRNHRPNDENEEDKDKCDGGDGPIRCDFEDEKWGGQPIYKICIYECEDGSVEEREVPEGTECPDSFIKG